MLLGRMYLGSFHELGQVEHGFQVGFNFYQFLPALGGQIYKDCGYIYIYIYIYIHMDVSACPKNYTITIACHIDQGVICRHSK